MQTKLVYVLTCAKDSTYIEQALISIWSARYHNQDAHIVLIVDDVTRQQLSGKRATILDYVTECIVVPFLDANATMMYRSRYIKTQVRKMVTGDMLFIDSDTIINGSLEEIDTIKSEVGAVFESNLLVNQFCLQLYLPIYDLAKKMGWSLEDEIHYFSSGVIYAKDTPIAHALFEKWHSNWLQGLSLDIRIDQPSLAKANIECGRVIRPIENKWNCIMFTYPRCAKDALILHFAAYRNMSFLFSKRVLRYIKENGLTDYIKYYILHPTYSYIPFDSEFYHFKFKDFGRIIKNIHKGLELYAKNIDSRYDDFIIKSKLYKVALPLMKRGCYLLASLMIVLSHWYRTRLSKKYKYIENICSNM